MGTEHELDDSDTDFRRLVVGIALLMGLAASVLAVFGTQDRYYGKDATRDFRLVHQEIAALRREVERNSATIIRIDETHPPPDLIKAVDALEARLWSMELESARSKNHSSQLILPE